MIKGNILLIVLVIGMPWLGGCCLRPYQPNYIIAEKAEKEDSKGLIVEEQDHITRSLPSHVNFGEVLPSQECNPPDPTSL